MKANAPEKIYLYPSDRAGEEYEDEWATFPRGEGCVEYTRTDAFIEKACNGIEKLLSGYIIRNFNFGDSYAIDRLIEDFRNYMKGEITMATIKSFTDLSQSKVLAEILPLESADMYYWCGEDLRVGGHKAMDIDFDVPCWSLAALLNVLDIPTLEKDNIGEGKTGWRVSVYPDNCRHDPLLHDSAWHNNPIDACVVMIIKLHEQKLL